MLTHYPAYEPAPCRKPYTDPKQVRYLLGTTENIDSDLFHLGYDPRTPSPPYLTGNPVESKFNFYVFDSYLNTNEMREKYPQYRSGNDHLGTVSVVRFPNLYAVFFTHLHREGVLCDALGIVANTILCADPRDVYPAYKYQDALLNLYLHHYNNNTQALHKTQHRFAQQAFAALDWNAHGLAVYHDHPRSALAEFATTLPAEEALRRAVAAFPDYQIEVVSYPAMEANAYPTYYDEAGNVIGGFQSMIPTKFYRQVLDYYRLRKLNALLA